MNLFILDTDPAKNAEYHVDAHVRKMHMEACQLLCNAHHAHGTASLLSDHYKPSHTRHTLSPWVAETPANYQFAYQYAKALWKEYQYRYGKAHASQRLEIPLSFSPWDLQAGVDRPTPAQAPAYYLVSWTNADVKGVPHSLDEAIVMYREYYWKEKYHLSSWSGRATPRWIRNRYV